MEQTGRAVAQHLNSSSLEPPQFLTPPTPTLESILLVNAMQFAVIHIVSEPASLSLRKQKQREKNDPRIKDGLQHQYEATDHRSETTCQPLSS